MMMMMIMILKQEKFKRSLLLEETEAAFTVSRVPVSWDLDSLRGLFPNQMPPNRLSNWSFIISQQINKKLKGDWGFLSREYNGTF